MTERLSTWNGALVPRASKLVHAALVACRESRKEFPGGRVVGKIEPIKSITEDGTYRLDFRVIFSASDPLSDDVRLLTLKRYGVPLPQVISVGVSDDDSRRKVRRVVKELIEASFS